MNPCDPGDWPGVNFTVPAQQFNVIRTNVADASGAVAEAVMYYGERANSAPDRLFSHNFQVSCLDFLTTPNYSYTPTTNYK